MFNMFVAGMCSSTFLFDLVSGRFGWALLSFILAIANFAIAMRKK